MTRSNRIRFFGSALLAAVMVAGAAATGRAELQRVGPVNNAPSVGGFPAWYQDTTGLALEFCDPQNAAEVAGGWCLLLPADVPAPPEAFPNEFFPEHFWFAANAGVNLGNGGRALLVLALEAAFVADVAPGGQIAFSRIRIRFSPAPATGTYRFIHPYGEEIVQAVQGDRIFVTEDVGINCAPGEFGCAILSRLGPFLLPSTTPGGPELPPIPLLQPGQDPFNDALAPPTPYPATGKKYIADPARLGPVTGSPLPPFTDSTGALRDHNIFRIEGPAGSNLDGLGNNFVETADFSLVGRIFEGAIPGRVTVDRATYARPFAGPQKLDVFATAFPAMQARLPAGPAPVVVTPLLRYYEAACAGALDAAGNVAPPYSAPAGLTPIEMASPGLMSPPQAAPGSIYWGQSQPALIPPSVCVEHQNAVNANNQIVAAFFPAPVTDQVIISSATYDPAGSGTLSVSAASSDEITPPTLTVAGLGDMANGLFSLSPLAAPPSAVRVLSSFGGTDQRQVTTGTGAPGGTGVPAAAGDAVTVAEDSGTTSILVLANDTLDGGPIPAGAIITIVSPPALGTAAVNGQAIDYTPNPNANGTDGFTYRVTVGTSASNIAAVTITITPVNDAPVAANDAFTAIAGVQTQLNVLANDTDPDGQADLTAAVNVTQPTPAGATVTVVNGLPIFTAQAGGVYTFTYQARDAAGAVSANTATVTVTVAAQETVSIQLAEFRTGGREWRVSGVVTPTASGTMTIRYANGPNAGFVVGTAAINPDGTWLFREANVTGLRDPRTGQASQIRATGPANGSATANITLRR